MSISLPPLRYNQSLFRSCFLKVHTRFYASGHSEATAKADQHNANVVANITRSPRVAKSGEGEKSSVMETKAKHELSNLRNPLEENKLDGHLKSVAAAGSQITLGDLEEYKPQTQPPTTSLQYEPEYNLLIQRLVRSFSLEQLIQVLELYHLQPPSKPTKRKCARSIVEQQWNWPSLADARRRKSDSEFSSRTFPLARHASFLLLGKDGSQLLQLSLKHNVHVSFSDRPLSLKAAGLKNSLRLLEQDVKDFIAEITNETFILPFKRGISLDLVEHVSRISGAFLEIVDYGKLRIFHRKTHPQTLLLAKELIMRGLCQDAFLPNLAYFTPPNPALETAPAYSMYPFFPAQALLWVAKGKSYFRVRQVGRWLDPSPHGDAHGLAGTEGVTLATSNDLTQIKSCLLAMLGEPSSIRSPVIRARPGHLVLGTSSLQRTSLTPPLKGSLEMSKIVRWIHDSHNRMDLVPCLFGASPGSHSQKGHRTYSLLYAALESNETSNEASRPSTRKVLEFKFMVSPRGDLTSHGGDADPSSEDIDDTATLDNTPEGKFLVNGPSCQAGFEGTLDLLMPDRDADIRFSATDLTSLLPHDWPQQLKNYSQQVDNFLSSSDRSGVEPEPPLSVTHCGVVYALDARSYIRCRTIPSLDAPFGSSEEVVCLGSLNGRSHQETTIHQVICSNLADDAEWACFIERCNSLTTRITSTDKGRAENCRIL